MFADENTTKTTAREKTKRNKGEDANSHARSLRGKKNEKRNQEKSCPEGRGGRGKNKTLRRFGGSVSSFIGVTQKSA